MIRIDAQKKTILFSKPYDGGEPPVCRDAGTGRLPIRECPLLMGYQCPECQRLILAYFKTEEPFDISAYLDEGKVEEYRTFQVPGAGGIERIDHERIRPESAGGFECAWTLCGAISHPQNVNQMLTAVYHPLTKYPYRHENPAPTVRRISDEAMTYLTQLEGVKFIPDICKSGEPMILLQKETLIESLEQAAGPQPPWSQRDEHKAWEGRRKAALHRFVEQVSGQKPCSE